MTTSLSSSASPLGRDFYARDAVTVARELLGRTLCVETEGGAAAGRIVETEAYCGPHDRAAHSFGGRRTPRNETMWGPAGRLYVYRIYGMHWCANVVCAGAGVPEAVLLRGLEPLEGLDVMRRRRGPSPRDAHLLRGPGCLTKGLGLHGGHDGASLSSGALRILDAPAVLDDDVGTSRRIGIDYAGPDADRPWRFHVRGSPGVSGPAALRR